MKIIVNGQDVFLDRTVDVEALIEAQGFGGMLVAVARNGAFVPRGSYGDVMVEEGDSIEIVSPMQGG